MSLPEANSNGPGGQGTSELQGLILTVATSLWPPLKHRYTAQSYRALGTGQHSWKVEQLW